MGMFTEAGAVKASVYKGCVRECEKLRADNERLRAAVAQQAEDDGLWFIAETAPEAYLQNALRYLHALIEQDARALAALKGVESKESSALAKATRRAAEELQGFDKAFEVLRKMREDRRRVESNE